MELNKIEEIIEKYFQGETTIAEENLLKRYFSASDIAPHLASYKPFFNYFSQAKEEKSKRVLENLTATDKEVTIHDKKPVFTWLSIAASVLVVLGVGTYFYQSGKQEASIAQSELGTYDDPEKALAATQKALALLSNNVNVGIESVQYVKEFEQSKNKIFKQ
jgi:uncharacterized protein HemX